MEQIKTPDTNEDGAETPAVKVSRAIEHDRRVRWFRHVGFLALETTLFGVVLGMAGFGALIVQLQKGPLQAPILEKPVRAILEDVMGGDRADVSPPELRWDKSARSVALHIATLQVSGGSGPLAALSDVTLTLDPAALLFGKVRIPHASVGSVGLRLARGGDGALTLTGAPAGGTTQNTNMAPINVARLFTMLAHIKDLQIQQASVLLDLKTGGADEAPKIYKNVRIHMTGRMRPNPHGSLSVSFGEQVTPLGGIDRFGAAYVYDERAGRVHLAFDLPQAQLGPLLSPLKSVFDLPDVDLNVAGQAKIELTESGRLQSASVQLSAQEGTFAWPAYDVPQTPIRRVSIAGGYDAEQKRIYLLPSGFMLKGIELSAFGEITQQKTPDHWHGLLTLESPVIALDALDPLWPEKLPSGTREWIVGRMQGGRFAGVHAELPIDAKQDKNAAWAVDVGTGASANFRCADVTVHYHDHLKDVHKVTGTGAYKNLGLTLNLTDGYVDNLHIKQGRLFIDDLVTPGTGAATLDLLVNGPVSDLAKYLSVPPVHLQTRTDLKLQQAKGNGAYDVQVIFPITADAKASDVKIRADITATDLDVPDVLRGLSLRGGPYTLSIKDDLLRFSGSGNLSGQPSTIALTQDLRASAPPQTPSFTLNAQVKTDDAGRTPFLGRVAGQVTGAIPATISYASTFGGVGTLQIDADANAATIDFAPLSYTKPQGTQTTLSCTGHLQNGVLQSIDAIKVGGNAITATNGRITFSPAGDVSSVRFDTVRAGRTSGKLDYTWDAAAGEKVVFAGSGFDISARAKTQQKNKKPSAMDAQITADKLYLSDKLPIDSARLEYATNAAGKTLRMNVSGRAQGSPLSVRYTAGSSLTMTAENAGAALSALNITDRVLGGKLDLNARPAGGADVDGRMLLSNFSARNAPALAKLINLLSLPGLLSILQQDTGLSFTRLESRIHWTNRDGASVFTFKEGRTSGSSLGLTFEGDVNDTAGTMDLQGTAVPMSEVNALVGKIPLLGDVLTGGSKGAGVFAATYTVKGSASNPDVSVNPLSVLAPGIFRKMLFEQ